MWGDRESVSSKGVYPESVISYPRPCEKMAEARGGGRGGKEKAEKNDLVSLKMRKSSSEGRRKQTEDPAGLEQGKQAGQGWGLWKCFKGGSRGKRARD